MREGVLDSRAHTRHAHTRHGIPILFVAQMPKLVIFLIEPLGTAAWEQKLLQRPTLKAF